MFDLMEVVGLVVIAGVAGSVISLLFAARLMCRHCSIEEDSVSSRVLKTYNFVVVESMRSALFDCGYVWSQGSDETPFSAELHQAFARRLSELQGSNCFVDMVLVGASLESLGREVLNVLAGRGEFYALSLERGGEGAGSPFKAVPLTDEVRESVARAAAALEGLDIMSHEKKVSK